VAYQTGTASSPIDLLQKMVTWLVSIGWTQDMSASDAPGWRAHLHKGAIYVHLYAAMYQQPWAGSGNTGHAIFLYLSSAFDGGQPWNAQPGNPPLGNGTTHAVGVGMPLETAGAIQNYYFFSDAAGDNIVLVVERTPGLYVYLGWGASLLKVGTWTGGQYFFGSMDGAMTCYLEGYGYPVIPSAGIQTTSSCPGALDYLGADCFFVRCDVDSFTGKWLGLSNNTNVDWGYTGKFCMCSVAPSGNATLEYSIAAYTSSGGPAPPFGTNTWDFQNVQTSSADARANLLPPLIWAQRDIGEYSLIGSIPNVFASNGVGSGFSNASEYVIGTTTYKMFPYFAVIKQ